MTSKGTKLCCPWKKVLKIVENPDISPFTEENGEVVIS